MFAAPKIRPKFKAPININFYIITKFFKERIMKKFLLLPFAFAALFAAPS